MKAILNRDLIVKLSMSIGTEIGRIPRGVGLDRLRWDGEKIVDLMDLTIIHVEHVQGVFILHAIEIPGTTFPITMNYLQRQKLVFESGVVRLMDDTEITRKQLAKQSLIDLYRTRQGFFLEEILVTFQVMIRYMGAPNETDRAWLQNRYGQITTLLNRIEELKSNINS